VEQAGGWVANMKIHFITTGGTIDKVYFDAASEYQVGTPQVQEVLAEAHVTFEFEVESVLRKDSLDLTESDRRLIRERVLACPGDRVVITHGTDTMVETALQLLEVPGKTIVLTGSMQPARFRNTDAAFNIGTAMGAVQVLPPGVYVAMNGRVWDPRRVRKNRSGLCFEELPG
jgi:L-asparaginase